MARSGFTLPVFAAAAAKAALQHVLGSSGLKGSRTDLTVELDISPDRVEVEPVEIEIEQGAVHIE